MIITHFKYKQYQVVKGKGSGGATITGMGAAAGGGGGNIASTITNKEEDLKKIRRHARVHGFKVDNLQRHLVQMEWLV